MPPLKYITIFNSRLICLAVSPSVFLICSSQALVLTSGYCLLLPMLPHQARQMSLVFGLGFTFFRGGISSSHVCVIVLRYLSCFWASAMAVEPRSSIEVCLTWGAPSRNRRQRRAPATSRIFLVKVTPVVTPWGTCHFLPCELPCAQDMVLSPTTLPQPQKVVLQSRTRPHQG